MKWKKRWNGPKVHWYYNVNNPVWQCENKHLLYFSDICFSKFFRQILSYNLNINNNSSADWSVWNLRVKTIKTKDLILQRPWICYQSNMAIREYITLFQNHLASHKSVTSLEGSMTSWTVTATWGVELVSSEDWSLACLDWFFDVGGSGILIGCCLRSRLRKLPTRCLVASLTSKE